MPATAAGRQPRPLTAPTPTRLLDAAERLFVTRGFAATSVRDITSEADCNIAGINYHFGSKDQLYREVFARRLGELRDGRLAALQRALRARDGSLSLEALLDAFARAFLAPLASQGEGRALIELMMREYAEPHLPPAMFRDEFVEPIERAVAAALCRSLDGLSPPAARRCVRSVVAQLLHEVHVMRRQSPPPAPAAWRSALERSLDHIVQFSAAGIRACAASEGGR